MQTFSWYGNRLRSMSLAEISWRTRSRLRGVIDRMLLLDRSRPMTLTQVLRSGVQGAECDGRVVGAHLQGDGGFHRVELTDLQRERSLAHADQLMRHRFSMFGRNDVDLGSPIRWNREPNAGIDTPFRPALSIDYRDYQETGDCKWVWEANRHQHLVVLARAYRATGDVRYAHEVARQMLSWVEQCPYGYGMNWRSPLELAIRLINWVWAIELIRPSGAITNEFDARVVPSVYRHVWDISRNHSRFSSANNHLIGEAAGVYIASRYFKWLKNADRWQQQAKEILEREIERQTYGDGGHKEQASGYHLFVTEFFLLAGLTGRNCGDDFSGNYRKRLESMFEYIGALLEGGSWPMLGDADDGYVIDLGDRGDSARALLSVGAELFDRQDFRGLAGGASEPCLWLLGVSSGRSDDAISAKVQRAVRIRSRALVDSGQYLLQRGELGKSDCASVMMDCGPLGFESIAAHGHADALSVTLRIGGRDVLVDPGTFDYFTYGPWRDYFRGTAAHNTVLVDGQDQSLMLGSFLWGRQAVSRCVDWRPTDRGGVVVGEHDGYSQLPDPVMHRRTVIFEDESDAIIIRDELRARGEHEIVINWHFAEQCQVVARNRDRYEVDFGGGVVHFEMPGGFDHDMPCGSENPIGGWVSRGYHQKSPAPTLRLRTMIRGSRTFETRIQLPQIASRDHGNSRSAISVASGDLSVVTRAGRRTHS